MASIVYITSFRFNSNYSNYLDYMNRFNENNKKEKSFEKYLNYMDRDSAKNNFSSQPFNSSNNNLNKKEHKKIKKEFKQAEKNGSILWTDVVSFDNEFLEEIGVYDKDKNFVDENKIKDSISFGIESMIEKENISNANWIGNLHYNEGNIHCHLAIVQNSPTRTRGLRKQKNLEIVKSKILSNLNEGISKDLDREINSLIRDNIIGAKKTIKLSENNSTKKLFLEALKKLPEDKRFWKYKMNKIDNVRPLIDKMTEIYIRENHKEDYEKLNFKLDKKNSIYEKLYGSQNNRKTYKENKLDDLKIRMGNSILKEMIEFDKSQKEFEKKKTLLLNTVDKKISSSLNNRNKYKNLNKEFEYRLKDNFQHEYESFKNQHEFNKLEYERS